MNGAGNAPTVKAARIAQRGFTLIEVMVALTIVVLGIAAVWSGSSQATINANRLQKKTFANWIAMNRMAELRLERAWPEPGRSDGDVEFANREWRWFANVTATQVENMRRVEISVTLADHPDELLINLVGFLSRPANAVVAVTPWAGNQVLPGEEQAAGNGNRGRPGRRNNR